MLQHALTEWCDLRNHATRYDPCILFVQLISNWTVRLFRCNGMNGNNDDNEYDNDNGEYNNDNNEWYS